jgi:hypothetical protein
MVTNAGSAAVRPEAIVVLQIGPYCVRYGARQTTIIGPAEEKAFLLQGLV